MNRAGRSRARNAGSRIPATLCSRQNRSDPLPHPSRDACPSRRCVVLKLASLGMFSFSLGQTVLCIGRNQSSCEPYGYDACDYRVSGSAVPPGKPPSESRRRSCRATACLQGAP